MFTAEWIWLYIGAALMMLELVSPGFVIFFFGLAAATVGVLRMIFAGSFTTTWQLVAFAGFLPGEFHGHRSLVGYSPWVAETQTLSD